MSKRLVPDGVIDGIGDFGTQTSSTGFFRWPTDVFKLHEIASSGDGA